MVFGVLFFINQNAFAQKLLLENNVSLTTYKLGYLRHVRISSVNDSTKTFGAYIRKVKHDTLYFIGGKKIALADINSIRFTPKNLFTRVGKPLIYGLGITLSAFLAINFEATDIEITNELKWKTFAAGLFPTIFLTETTGTVLWLITPKRELRRGINLAILNK